jgi:hypothetical protein
LASAVLGCLWDTHTHTHTHTHRLCLELFYFSPFYLSRKLFIGCWIY